MRLRPERDCDNLMQMKIMQTDENLPFRLYIS